MQSLSTISTTGGMPLILVPLAFVMSICGIKDFVEDHKRTISDNIENNRKIELYDYNSKQFIEIKWADIETGNIIRIKSNQSVPSDLVLLKTSETHDVCYVETKMLDGETNLKVKQSCSVQISAQINDSILTNKEVNQKIKVQCDRPNTKLYRFSGEISCDEK